MAAPLISDGYLCLDSKCGLSWNRLELSILGKDITPKRLLRICDIASSRLTAYLVPSSRVNDALFSSDLRCPPI